MFRQQGWCCALLVPMRRWEAPLQYTLLARKLHPVSRFLVPPTLQSWDKGIHCGLNSRPSLSPRDRRYGNNGHSSIGPDGYEASCEPAGSRRDNIQAARCNQDIGTWMHFCHNLHKPSPEARPLRRELPRDACPCERPILSDNRSGSGIIDKQKLERTCAGRDVTHLARRSLVKRDIKVINEHCTYILIELGFLARLSWHGWRMQKRIRSKVFYLLDITPGCLFIFPCIKYWSRRPFGLVSMHGELLLCLRESKKRSVSTDANQLPCAEHVAHAPQSLSTHAPNAWPTTGHAPDRHRYVTQRIIGRSRCSRIVRYGA